MRFTHVFGSHSDDGLQDSSQRILGGLLELGWDFEGVGYLNRRVSNLMDKFVGILMQIHTQLQGVHILNEFLVVEDQVKVSDEEDGLEFLGWDFMNGPLIPFFDVVGEEFECFVELFVEELMEHQPYQHLINFDLGTNLNDFLFAEVPENDEGRLLNIITMELESTISDEFMN